jgi:hypothetical protein
MVVATFLGGIIIISFLSPSLAQSWSHFDMLSTGSFVLSPNGIIRSSLDIDNNDRVIFDLRDATGNHSAIQLIVDRYGNASIVDSQGISLLPNIPRGLPPIEDIPPSSPRAASPQQGPSATGDEGVSSGRADYVSVSDYNYLIYQLELLRGKINEINARLRTIAP